MLGLSFASVPLYDLFCRVTGYAGTVQRASLAPGSNGQYRNIQIRFDSNISQEPKAGHGLGSTKWYWCFCSPLISFSLINLYIS